MSVRGHLIKDVIVTTSENYIKVEKIIEKESRFNVYHDPKIFKIFQDYGSDSTTVDCFGEVSISDDEWKEFMKDFKKEDYNKRELDILAKIEQDLTGSYLVFYECF